MAESVSFVGGMNVPAVIGRFTASRPLAELVIDDRSLCLRPRLFGALMMTRFQVDLDQISTAFPTRGILMGGGVGITLLDRSTAYFYAARRQQEVLKALEDRGVDVRKDAQRASQMFWTTRSGDSNAELPRFPKLLQALVPIFALLSVPVLYSRVADSESLGSQVANIAFWAVCAGIAIPIWWKSRN